MINAGAPPSVSRNHAILAGLRTEQWNCLTKPSAGRTTTRIRHGLVPEGRYRGRARRETRSLTRVAATNGPRVRHRGPEALGVPVNFSHEPGCYHSDCWSVRGRHDMPPAPPPWLSAATPATASEFATAARRVASAAGVRVLSCPRPTRTRLRCALLGADAGVMVTASHNFAPGTTATRSTLRRCHGRRQGRPDHPPLRCRDRRAIEATPPADQVPMNDDLVEAVDPRDEYVAEAVKLASGDAAARAPRASSRPPCTAGARPPPVC